MPDALTNFPNGISTGVVVLTGEAGFIVDGEDGSTIDLGTIKLKSDNLVTEVVSLTWHSRININGPTVDSTFVSLRLDTDVVGAGQAANNVVTLLDLNMDASAVTGIPGPIGRGIMLTIQPSSFSSFVGLDIGGMTVDVSNGTTRNNGGVQVGEIRGDAVGGGVVNNRGFYTRMPVGQDSGGGNVRNYGLLIEGNGNPAATQNWAIYTLSTLPVYFGGPVIQHPATNTVPPNNGDMTVSVTSNTQLTVRLKGTDGTVRSVVLTLT